MQGLLLWLDPLFITPYRWLPHAESAYLLGTGLLALWAVGLGLLSLRCARRLHKKRLDAMQEDMRHYHHLSEKALMLGSKESFKAVNKQAHEAFGRHFSLSGALFVISLWPVPLVLAWMQGRFGTVGPELPFALPLLGQAPGFVFWFLLCYIPLRMWCRKLAG